MTAFGTAFLYLVYSMSCKSVSSSRVKPMSPKMPCLPHSDKTESGKWWLLGACLMIKVYRGACLRVNLSLSRPVTGNASNARSLMKLRILM